MRRHANHFRRLKHFETSFATKGGLYGIWNMIIIYRSTLPTSPHPFEPWCVAAIKYQASIKLLASCTHATRPLYMLMCVCVCECFLFEHFTYTLFLSKTHDEANIFNQNMIFAGWYSSGLYCKRKTVQPMGGVTILPPVTNSGIFRLSDLLQLELLWAHPVKHEPTKLTVGTSSVHCFLLKGSLLTCCKPLVGTHYKRYRWEGNKGTSYIPSTLDSLAYHSCVEAGMTLDRLVPVRIV